jgi:hypothetical protein
MNMGPMGPDGIASPHARGPRGPIGIRIHPSRVGRMFRHRERMVKILGVLLAAALVLSLVIPILGSTGP